MTDSKAWTALYYWDTQAVRHDETREQEMDETQAACGYRTTLADIVFQYFNGEREKSEPCVFIPKIINYERRAR